MKNNRINRRRLLVILPVIVLTFNLFPITVLAADMPPYSLITIKAFDDSKEYDGTPLEATFKFQNLPMNVIDTKLIFDPSRASITDPGELKIQERGLWGYEAYDKDGNNLVHMGKVQVRLFEEGTLTVTKRKVTLSVVGDNSMTAGSKLPNLDVEVTSGSFLDGDTPTEYNLSIAGDIGVPGEYDIMLDVEYPDEERHEKYYDVVIKADKMVVYEEASEEKLGENLNQDIPIVPPTDSVIADPIVPDPVIPAVPVIPNNLDALAESVNLVVEIPNELISLGSDTSVATMADTVMQVVADAVPKERLIGVEASEDAPEVTEIEESKVPLVTLSAQSGWALWNLILTIVAGIIMAVLMIGYVIGQKCHTEEHDIKRKGKGIIRLLSIAVTLVAFIVFMLTEDIRQVMVMVDQWTVWMAVIVVVQVGVAFLSKKNKRSDEPMDAQPMNG